jgi:flagellar basal-body rod modification protein FlgD
MATAVAAKPDTGQTLNSLIGVSKPKASDQTEDRFLKLLVTQMQNQDPLNPMDNAQVTSQIAQINTVNGIEKLNSAFAGFSASVLSTQALQATGLIGHGVLANGNSMQLANGHAIGGVALTEPVDDLVVTITSVSGQTMRTMHLGAQDAASMVFDWDGTGDAGGTAAPGKYLFKVSATRGNQNIDVTPLAFGTVGSVGINGSTLTLDTDTLGSVAVSDIKRII